MPPVVSVCPPKHLRPEMAGSQFASDLTSQLTCREHICWSAEKKDPETQAASFPPWKAELANTGWPAAKHAEYRREILGILHRCKVGRAPATIMLAKEYMASREREGANGARVPLLAGR